MQYPMRRLNKEELDKLISNSTANFDDLLRDRFNPFHETNDKNDLHKRKTILDYYDSYITGSILPSDVMKRTIQKVKEWENDGMIIFSSYIEEDILVNICLYINT